MTKVLLLFFFGTRKICFANRLGFFKKNLNQNRRNEVSSLPGKSKRSLRSSFAEAKRSKKGKNQFKNRLDLRIAQINRPAYARLSHFVGPNSRRCRVLHSWDFICFVSRFVLLKTRKPLKHDYISRFLSGILPYFHF
jgi:hypothetical protein